MKIRDGSKVCPRTYGGGGALAQELQGEDIYYNTDGQPVVYWILTSYPLMDSHLVTQKKIFLKQLQK